MSVPSAPQAPSGPAAGSVPPAGADATLGLPGAALPTPAGYVATPSPAPPAVVRVRKRDSWAWGWPVIGLLVIATASELAGTVWALAACAVGVALAVLVLADQVIDGWWRTGTVVACLLALAGVFTAADAVPGVRSTATAPATREAAGDLRGRTFTPEFAARTSSFAGASLDGAVLDSLVLDERSFDGASAAGTSFRNAHLRGTTWRGADLRGADFTGACLRGADFTGAVIDGLVATGAVVDGVIVSKDALARASAWPVPGPSARPGC